MINAESALVVTSINPFSNLEYQLKCFEKWKSVGFNAVTCNIQAEAGLLEEAGLPRSQVHEISEEESGKRLFGKPVPLVQPILNRLEKKRQSKFVLITNSDIYPAIRSSSIVRYWSTHASGLALTRDETHDLSAHDFDTTRPYQGGLDAFLMDHAALQKVNRLLSSFYSASRMAFGVPGWDYLLAACIISDGLKGKIIDSRVLLHRSHKTTYNNIDEFGYYVQDMRRLGVVNVDDPAQAAEQFAGLIKESAVKNESFSATAKLIYYRAPDRYAQQVAASDKFERAWCRLRELAPFLDGYYRTKSLVSLFDRLASDPGASLELGISFLVDSTSVLFQYSQTLLAIVFALLARYAESAPPFVREYPKGNRHVAALQHILKRHSEDCPLRRVWIARLFGAELVDHGVFNPRLYQYLILASDNDSELRLLEAIGQLAMGRYDKAA